MAGRPSFQMTRPQYLWILEELERDRANERKSILDKRIERVHDEIVATNDAIFRAQRWRDLLCDELLKLIRMRDSEIQEIEKTA